MISRYKEWKRKERPCEISSFKKDITHRIVVVLAFFFFFQDGLGEKQLQGGMAVSEKHE